MSEGVKCPVCDYHIDYTVLEGVQWEGGYWEQEDDWTCDNCNATIKIKREVEVSYTAIAVKPDMGKHWLKPRNEWEQLLNPEKL